MIKVRFLFIGMALLLVLAGCRESAQPTAASSLQIEFNTDPLPPVPGEGTLIITVKDANGAAVNDATVTVRGDMNHAGMVPVEGESQEASDGLYRIPFNWSMGGDWILTVTATRPDGTTGSQRFDVSVGAMDDNDMNMPEMTPEATG